MYASCLAKSAARRVTRSCFCRSRAVAFFLLLFFLLVSNGSVTAVCFPVFPQTVVKPLRTQKLRNVSSIQEMPDRSVNCAAKSRTTPARLVLVVLKTQLNPRLRVGHTAPSTDARLCCYSLSAVPGLADPYASRPSGPDCRYKPLYCQARYHLSNPDPGTDVACGTVCLYQTAALPPEVPARPRGGTSFLLYPLHLVRPLSVP